MPLEMSTQQNKGHEIEWQTSTSFYLAITDNKSSKSIAGRKGFPHQHASVTSVQSPRGVVFGLLVCAPVCVSPSRVV